MRWMTMLLVALWSVSALAGYQFVDLGESPPKSPAGASVLHVTAWSGQQVGGFTYGLADGPQALLWPSRNADPVNLTPSGWYACLYGMDETSQVGVGFGTSSTSRALLWHGLSSMVVDLTPDGGYRAAAYGVSGNVQVGYVADDNGMRAAAWAGSASTFQNITPDNFDEAVAYGTWGPRKVGEAWTITAGSPQAVLWDGSASSNITPTGWWGASAKGIYQGLVAGEGWQTYEAGHALLWDLDNGTWQDLHAYVPAEYPQSGAHAVMADGTVRGFVYDVGGARHEAMWQLTPEPTTIVMLLLAMAGAFTCRRGF